MNANFQYIELKDRRLEWMNMSCEDKPEWNYQHLHMSYHDNILLERNKYEPIVAGVGLYLLEKLSIKNEYYIGDGLGLSKQGIVEPIQMTRRQSKCHHGIGFQYDRRRKYPNRHLDFIRWVK